VPVAACSALKVEVACVQDMASVTSSSKDQVERRVHVDGNNVTD